MSQKDLQVQKAKQLHDSIQKMTEETEKLEAEVKQLAEEKGQAEKELAAATARIQEIQGSLPQKMQQLQHLQQQEQQKEAEYMRMLEAAPTLVQVLKK
mmetsp:Transcript_92463/g.220020  ORF Transcript_92463/g.220020 Transcript_92463/m.220020 type:complete len:98 (-) Transcript_92463:68-361(-)